MQQTLYHLASKVLKTTVYRDKKIVPRILVGCLMAYTLPAATASTKVGAHRATNKRAVVTLPAQPPHCPNSKTQRH